MSRLLHAASSVVFVALNACGHGSGGVSPPALTQPETSTGFRKIEPSTAKTFMAATANPKSTAAAVEILEAGGNAVDAAIAAQLVLTVVEPQSSGIGGGLFLLFHDRAGKRTLGYDGREKAPTSMGPRTFLRDDGTPKEFLEAAVGGLAVGVPGALAALYKAHSSHGALPWEQLFEPAIGLARNGWDVDPRLANGLKFAPKLSAYAGRDSMFFDRHGEPRKAGDRVTNPALATTLARIASEGIDVFYRGDIAAQIVDVVQSDENRGNMTLDDLAAYRAEVREPRCMPYREFTVCGFPPPAGSLVALTILELLEPFDLKSLEPNGVEFMHLYAQANMLAYSDRDTYYADPALADVPINALLAPKRLNQGSAFIQAGPIKAADTHWSLPPVTRKRKRHATCAKTSWFVDGTTEAPSTSHVSIMDTAGNVVSMTASVEFNFGSSTMAGGFVLNNQLTDFEFQPCTGASLKANAAEPGKRPRSSMSPVIVFNAAGEPILAVGSPGGAAIISYTAQTIIAILDWQLNPQDAAALPHLVGQGGKTILENHPALDAAIPDQLRQLGHQVELKQLTSGLSVIQRGKHGLRGGADPRRDGIAAGD